MKPAFNYNPEVPFVDVLVPTIDSVRFGYLMELLLSVNRAVLFTGPTGSVNRLLVEIISKF